MIYHYFGNKNDLYLAALEASYRTIREQERALDLQGADPVSAMHQLVDLTFDFLATDPYFVRLIMSENLMMGRLVSRSKTITKMTRPLLETLDGILKRGQLEGIFPKDIDSEHLYISILSLCFTHVSNRYTLAAMFKRDFSDPKWLEQRKAVVSDIIITYMTSDSASGWRHQGT
jgi:AcrR family transcriptional regulator